MIFDRESSLVEIVFNSQSGRLRVQRDSHGRYELNSPSRPPIKSEFEDSSGELLGALGVECAEWVGKSRDHFVVIANQTAVAALKPDFERMMKFDTSSVIVTAPGDDLDFVSRNFAPGYGIDEDPVTGSAHCTLTPFWAQRLGKDQLHAKQISARGGELWCGLRGDRVAIAGDAVTYLKGQISI